MLLLHWPYENYAQLSDKDLVLNALDEEETDLMATSIVDDPPVDIASVTDRDVLLGRGGGVNNHSGNRVYRRLIDKKRSLYRSLPDRADKSLLIRSVFQALQNNNVRFLKKKKKSKSTHEDVWFEISEVDAMGKISQAFREGGSGAGPKQASQAAQAMVNKAEEEKMGAMSDLTKLPDEPPLLRGLSTMSMDSSSLTFMHQQLKPQAVVTDESDCQSRSLREQPSNTPPYYHGADMQSYYTQQPFTDSRNMAAGAGPPEETLLDSLPNADAMPKATSPAATLPPASFLQPNEPPSTRQTSRTVAEWMRSNAPAPADDDGEPISTQDSQGFLNFMRSVTSSSFDPEKVFATEGNIATATDAGLPETDHPEILRMMISMSESDHALPEAYQQEFMRFAHQLAGEVGGGEDASATIQPPIEIAKQRSMDLLNQYMRGSSFPQTDPPPADSVTSPTPI